MNRVQDLRTKAAVTAAYLKGRKETKEYSPTKGRAISGWYLIQNGGYSKDYSHSGGREVGECWGGKDLFLGDNGKLYVYSWDREEWSGETRRPDVNISRIEPASDATLHNFAHGGVKRIEEILEEIVKI